MALEKYYKAMEVISILNYDALVVNIWLDLRVTHYTLNERVLKVLIAPDRNVCMSGSPFRNRVQAAAEARFVCLLEMKYKAGIKRMARTFEDGTRYALLFTMMTKGGMELFFEKLHSYKYISWHRDNFLSKDKAMLQRTVEQMGYLLFSIWAAVVYTTKEMRQRTSNWLEHVQR